MYRFFMSYTVKSGDTLGAIALRFLGNSNRWPEIVSKNPILASRKKMSDGSPVIFVGDALILEKENPSIVEDGNVDAAGAKNVVALDEKAAQDVSIDINGNRFTGFTAYTLSFPSDTFDAFSFSSVWDAERDECKAAFGAFTYAPCSVRLDGELLFSGVLLPASPSVSDSSRTISLQGYPKCGVLGDSCLPLSAFPAEFNGLTLSQIAKKCASPFGVAVKIDGDEGAAFDEEVSISPSETVLSFLEKLAKQRGLIISNTQAGELLLYAPKEEKSSVELVEGKPPFVSMSVQFDGQKMFSHVIGLTPVKDKKDEKAASFVFENKALISRGVLRVHSETIEDATEATIESATKALAARMLASSAKWSLTVKGHRGSDGKIYHKNQTVLVYAPNAEIYKKTALTIDEVTLKRSDSEGAVAVLSLVLPGVRSGALPDSFPWEE